VLRGIATRVTALMAHEEEEAVRRSEGAGYERETSRPPAPESFSAQQLGALARPAAQATPPETSAS
jgi:hypothetical protein